MPAMTSTSDSSRSVPRTRTTIVPSAERRWLRATHFFEGPSLAFLIEASEEAEKTRRLLFAQLLGIGEIEIARRMGDIVSVQNALNVRQQWSVEVLDYCTSEAISFIPWMPLGDGGISWDDPMLTRLADKYEATAPQIALSALLHRSPIMLPIPGTSSMAHLRENVEAAGIELEAGDLALLWGRP